ncbi:MAG: SCO family protein [Flavobacterium sp.]
MSEIKNKKPLILFYFIFSIVFISLAYYFLKPKKTLKIFNPIDVNPELVDSTVQHISKYHTIAPFKFLNQNGDTITEKDYEGKVYVTEFFFTTCQSICVPMNENMLLVQKAIEKNDKAKILSFTVMPEIDSIETLKKYEQKKGINSKKWNLLTGKKEDIYFLARKSFLVVKTQPSESFYDMVHTENFVLVDTKKRIRGFYDGTKKEEIKKLIEDINWLTNSKEEQ